LGGLIWRLATQFGVFSTCKNCQIQALCGGGRGGLGSPLAGFSPNTGISFLMISPKLLDIMPVFLFVFSPIKTAHLLILFGRQVMAILCCVAQKAASAAQSSIAKL
jgi:hypothetical protein